MNCQQGDLAIVIVSDAGNEGMIVRCVNLIGTRVCVCRDGTEIYDYLWEVNKNLGDWQGKSKPVIFDHQLQPLRPPASITDKCEWIEVSEYVKDPSMWRNHEPRTPV